MIVITSGKRYLDIDAYASMLAYRELLKLKGVEAKAVSNVPFNKSVPPSLLALPLKLDAYEVNVGDQFIVLDVSNKDFFASFVELDHIIEIIDHHPGNETFWADYSLNKCIIEPIGAVATIIVEFYLKENLLDRMDKSIAKLLMAAILDNTLYFGAKITKDRDREAYQKLKAIVKDNETFAENYFIECQEMILSQFEEAVKNDTKIEYVSPYLPSVFGQLILWDKDCIHDKGNTIKGILSSFGEDWMINIVSLKEGKSYLFYSNQRIKNNLETLFEVSSLEEYILLDTVWLRKEIMKKAIDKK